MGFDPRQLVAAFMTLTMFAMLGNMIKRDHLDFVQLKLPGTPAEAHFDKKGVNSGPWLDNGKELKPCWTKPTLENMEQSRGFVLFSLSNGPEYHDFQIAVVIIVARYLRATLVLPDIRGTKPGDQRNFGDIYDVEKFVKSLNGVVRITKEPPTDILLTNLAILRVPNQISEDYIAENIEPVFRKKGNIRLATYFNSINTKLQNKINPLTCLGMFGTLELKPEVRNILDLMIETLRRKSNGKFIAVDLRVDKFVSNGCQMNKCFSTLEIAMFLKKIGFDEDTVIYLTHSKWDSSLSDLKDFFPKTYTKESILGDQNSKIKILNHDARELEERVMDLYTCSESDVFVPALSGLFYENVAGRRIKNERTQILVPAPITSTSASAIDFTSHYVSRKKHLAFSCYCEA